MQKVLTERENVDQHIILQLICFLRKIVNHPRLIYNYVVKNQGEDFESEEENEELLRYEQKLAEEKIQKLSGG